MQIQAPAFGVSELFFPGGPEGWMARTISAIIFLLALAALAALTLFAGRLARERRALKRAQRDPEPWRERVRAAQLPGASPPGAARGLERRVWEVALAADADGSDLLSAADESRREASPSLVFARYVAGALVLFGLAGTLMGLSTGVIGLREFFTRVDGAGGGSPDPAELTRAILHVIAGLRTAFSTTLAGVVGTLGLRLGLTWVGGRILAYQAELDAFSATVLLPAARPTVDRSTTRAADAVTRLESRMSEILEILAASTAKFDALLGREAPTGTLAEHAAALHGSVTSLHDVLGEQKALAEGLRERIVEGTTQAAAALGQSLSVGADAQREAMDGLREMRAREVEASEQLQRFLAGLKPVEGRLDTFVGALQSAAGRMGETAQAEAGVLRAIEKVSEQLEHVAEALRLAGQQMENASSASEEFRDVLDTSLAQLGRALNRIAVFDGREQLASQEG